MRSVPLADGPRKPASYIPHAAPVPAPVPSIMHSEVVPPLRAPTMDVPAVSAPVRFLRPLLLPAPASVPVLRRPLTLRTSIPPFFSNADEKSQIKSLTDPATLCIRLRR